MSPALERLAGGLIVSCQPVVGGPLDDVIFVRALALATQTGGARGLRIEGAANVNAVVAACDLPVIGIVKRDLPDSQVRITPWERDVADLLDAGAGIIAYDATIRERPCPTAQLVQRIHNGSALAMADCASVADGRQALVEGADLLATTLSGYVDASGDDDPPDLDLVADLAKLGAFVVAEGRYRRTEEVEAAVAAGADAVVVGSAITRPEHVTAWFASAMQRGGRR
ncbi:MAG: putative N-acetylmannosamine-6-phosphate 2-epimerase [Pseudomonadota bacterium]